MIDLDCPEIQVVGGIQLADSATLGISAFFHGRYDCFLVSFLVGNREDRGFYIGRPDSHPHNIQGYQLKILPRRKIQTDDMLIPTIRGMIQNVGFFFRLCECNRILMVELAIVALFEDDSCLTAGLWANHKGPAGRRAADRVKRLFNFADERDSLLLDSMLSSSYSIGAH